MKQIPPNLAANICTMLGWDQCVIFCRKEGDDGGECVAYGGNSYRNGRTAQEMAEFLKANVFMWEREAEERVADDPVEREAQKEFARQAEAGKSLIFLPNIDKRQDERKAGKLPMPEKAKKKYPSLKRRG